jgi:hypothetical protein
MDTNNKPLENENSLPLPSNLSGPLDPRKYYDEWKRLQKLQDEQLQDEQLQDEQLEKVDGGAINHPAGSTYSPSRKDFK